MINRSFCPVWIGVAMIGLAASTVSAQPSYVLQDIGVASPLNFCLGGQKINASGQAIKTAATFTPTPDGYIFTASTYVVDTDGTATDLGTLFGHSEIGQAINSQGVVIGASGTSTQGDPYHAFIWSSTQGIQDLVPAATRAEACGMNANGDVVGSAYAPGLYAFVYTGGKTYNLNDLTVQGGGPWTNFDHAYSINDAGQIFGIGTINDEQHGFVLTPAPVPSPAASPLSVPARR